VPDVLVASSEKFGGTGILMESSSIGKFSGHGRPPPSEIKPGCFRYLAAALSVDGLRALASVLRMSVCSAVALNPGSTYDPIDVPLVCGQTGPSAMHRARQGTYRALELITATSSSRSSHELCASGIYLVDGDGQDVDTGYSINFASHCQC
jgi:hypothetical protein